MGVARLAWSGGWAPPTTATATHEVGIRGSESLMGCGIDEAGQFATSEGGGTGLPTCRLWLGQLLQRLTVARCSGNGARHSVLESQLSYWV